MRTKYNNGTLDLRAAAERINRIYRDLDALWAMLRPHVKRLEKPSILPKRGKFVKSAADDRLARVVPAEWARSSRFMSTLDEWLAYRAEVGKTVTMASLKANFASIRGCSAAEAVESMNNSMASNWMGLFPPKRRKGAEPRPSGGSDGDVIIPNITTRRD